LAIPYCWGANHPVQKDHHRAGDERRRDEAEADHQRVDPRVIGKAGGNAHDLGVATVDQETSVHLSFLELEWLRDRQRSGGRNEQKRGDERTGENGGGLADGSERSEHC
jgi:hypothetical protein